MEEKNNVWNQALKKVKKNISYSNYNVFFKSSFLDELTKEKIGFLAVLAVSNSFIRQSVENKHKDLIKNCLEEVLKEKVELNLIVKEKDIKEKIEETPLFNKKTENNLKKQIKNNRVNQAIEVSNLKKEYTFENFAVSPTNEVAYAAAMAVAKNPARAYNPLFLYGDVGVGKTHLMHSVGIRILQKNSETKLVYCMGEQFTNEIIDAIRLKRTSNFRARYRKATILLIDDIQFIAGKNTVQEEFFHTFNAIQSSEGQIILTSDRPPSEIKLLEDRLRSRFEEGLIIDIQEPNFELRTAILLIKSRQTGIKISMDVAQNIANNITSTRMLQGFLSKLHAVAFSRKTEISNEIVNEILEKDNIRNPVAHQKEYINPKKIINGVAKHFGVRTSSLFGPRRLKSLVVPRQYAMYFLKTDLDMSFVEIGRIFGGRDHSTVIHAVDKITGIVGKSEEKKRELSTIRKKVYG